MSVIGFIGLGTMGAPMARNLLKAGHELRVFDVTADACVALAAEGATAAGTAVEAAQGADFVITMLPNDAIVSRVMLGNDGLIERLSARPLLIDCSTISPDTSRRIARAAAEKGLRTIDAPVSGGPRGAADGTLSFMVGGAGEDFAQAEPVLKNMGRMIVHAGDSGAGQVAKLCNNMTVAVVMAATAEALALGISQGLDPETLSGIMAGSTAGSFVLDRWNPWPGVMPEAPASHDYAGGFQLGLMLKDLNLAVANARDAGASVPFGALAQSMYMLQARRGQDAPRADFSSIQKLFTRPA
ncbi:3-hydroxyisobutyrate dehydrogenase [Paracoccus sp. Z118]|uniref:3-hydroxyisobutyrate dehydrogenase n=1 Tax=Paracoccus sp. Z118 TaxID=2851017 RepID=UPI001C2C4871|nr:3-hydroxyisobutyrate dehydrogenase [Paracoccus sp. Z118]MBV0890882.1 3-hydroxyisobutyrate dehydrogenase [Paracoccus sp. Z118]